jgi:hypothetical protein
MAFHLLLFMLTLIFMTILAFKVHQLNLSISTFSSIMHALERQLHCETTFTQNCMDELKSIKKQINKDKKRRNKVHRKLVEDGIQEAITARESSKA